MKIINLIKSEFIKNYSIKRFIIISLLMIICSVIVVKFTNDDVGLGSINLQAQINAFEHSIEYIEDEKKENFDNRYSLYFYEKNIEYWNQIKDMGVTSSYDWKVTAVYNDLVPIIMENYLIDIIKSNTENKELIDIYESKSDELFIESEIKLNYLFNNYNLDELNDLYDKNNLIIGEYENLFKKDKYYLYLKYQVENKIIEDDRFIKILIDKKVESNLDYLGLNYMQYKNLEQNANIEIISEEEFKESGIGEYDSYDDYISVRKKMKDDAIKYREILLYSTEHEIKHDIVYNYNDNVYSITYMSSKLSVNRIFHFSIIITLIIAISSSGIISKEHNKGTIKNIITAPVKRWKILLSKFIYLILDTYFIWFLGLIILSIFSGIENGFSDLFSPKLIYADGNIVEINYYLYLLKDLFISSIPVICFLSILFFLSTVTLNTSLTVGIMSGLAVLSPTLWFIGILSYFKYIVYTPMWYFDCGFIFNNSQLYVDSLRYGSYDFFTGIIISIIFIIVLYFISNVVYIKRDIKN